MMVSYVGQAHFKAVEVNKIVLASFGRTEGENESFRDFLFDILNNFTVNFTANENFKVLCIMLCHHFQVARRGMRLLPAAPMRRKTLSHYRG